MFGGFGGWLYEAVAGLRRVGRGWTRFALGPANGCALLWLGAASASVDSPAGPVAAAWRAGPAPDVALQLDATVPTGASAAVAVPVRGAGGAAAGSVAESGSPVWRAGSFVAGVPGVFSARASPAGDAVIFEVGSGTFSFSSVGG